MAENRILSIWFFVGLMLSVYGAIITFTGIYFIFHPQNRTALANLNPNLWWGMIMFVFGLIFLILGIKLYRNDSVARERE